VTQLLTRTKTSVVGIEFGACSLRAVQLRKTGNRWNIHHWLNMEHEPVDAKVPVLDYESELKLAFGPGTFSGYRTALALSPPEVEYRLLEVPAAVLEKSNGDLRDAIRFELNRQLPWPADESEFAAWPVQSGSTSSANTMIAAIQRTHIQRYLDILDTRQIECILADVVPNAIIQLVRQSGHNLSHKLWAILDIGFSASRLYLIYEDVPVYARVVGGGGFEFTEILSKALHVEFRIAEQYKCIYGIKQTDRGFRSMAGGLARIHEEDLPGVLYAILRNKLNNMVGEIEKSYRFATGRVANAQTGFLYVIGGGARLKGLPEVLGKQLNLKVQLPDPEKCIDTQGSSSRHSIHPACLPSNFPVLATCIGLAMKEVTA